MKHRSLLLGAQVAACVLASCTPGSSFYRTGSLDDTSQIKSPPPAFGSPSYVSSIVGYGRPYARSGFYPYSSSHPGGMGYYDRVPSPQGSYHYFYHDLEQPPPSAHTPLKTKTWRYTSRYPTAWGCPMWVSVCTPRRSAGGQRAAAATPAVAGR